MNSELKQSKRAIRIFLRTAYTDERLTWLLAHAQNGDLSYQSCCCLVGVATANHPLRSQTSARKISGASHYAVARLFLGAREAEWAFFRLGFIGRTWRLTCDDLRRRRLIPMLRAEISRRSRPEPKPALAWPVPDRAEKAGVKSCWQDEAVLA